MSIRIFTFLRRLFITLGTLGFLGIALPRLITTLNSFDRIHQKEDAPRKRVAIVFGAGLRRDGTPTPILRDRVDTAVDLYLAGKVDTLLMSGDNSTPEYNEPAAMVAHAIARGVNPADVQPDYAGRRTYDAAHA